MIDYMLRDGISEGRIAEIMSTPLWRVQARGRALKRKPRGPEQRARHIEYCRRKSQEKREQLWEIRRAMAK